MIFIQELGEFVPSILTFQLFKFNQVVDLMYSIKYLYMYIRAAFLTPTFDKYEQNNL